MAITFQLKDKSRSTSSIEIFIRFRGASYKKSTGETTPPKHWNQNAKRCRVTRDYPEGEDVNTTLGKWDVAAKKTIEHFKEYKNLPSSFEFWEHFDSVYYKDATKKDDYFTSFLSQYIEGIKEVKAESTVKKYTTTLHKLTDYEAEKKRRLKFSDINIDFYNSFQRWIYKQNFSSNYFGTFIKIIKRITREAHYLGVTDSIRGIEHRDFITVNEGTDKVYLTDSEVGAIFNVEITPEAIRKEFEEYADASPENMRRKIESLKLVRERFLVGAYSGLRVSDFSRLDALNFGEKTIKTTTVKTGKAVVIPIHANIRKLFAEGFDPAVKISDQKMNKHLKELARLAGIKDDILITESIGGKNTAVKYKKYQLVCTHTARRSFATNALKAGVPLPSISKILGHTKISTTERYLRMSAEETAESIRNFGTPYLHASLKDFIEWLRCFGYEYEIDGNTMTFKKRDRFYDRSVMAMELRQSEVAELAIAVNNEHAYTGVRIGYDAQDYDSVNGLLEPNNGAFEYSTGYNAFEENALELVSPYRADSLGIEFLCWTRGESTTDNSSDNDIFVVALTDGGTNYVEYTGTVYADAGTGATPFNEPFSQFHLVERNMSLIGVNTKQLRFSSTEGSRTADTSVTDYYADVTVTEKLFDPGRCQFDTGYLRPLPDASVRNGLVYFDYGGITRKGFIREIMKNEAAEKSTTWTLDLVFE